MSNIIKTLKRNVKRVYKPIEKLLGITDTTIGKITKSKYTPSFIKSPLQSIQSYGHTVIEGRNDYPPSARAIIKQYGDVFIKSIKIIRQPIQSFINTAFNALTFGQFQKKLDTLPYDKLFHLRMVITMEDNKQIQIEKNEVINITFKIDYVKGQEEMAVNILAPITLKQLLDRGQKILKDKYFTYRAFGNNCQDFQIALLKGSKILTTPLENFIKQDISELANINPYLRKIANTFTDLGGKFNEIIHGTGIHSKHKNNYKVQSVLFDKKYWTVAKAKKWLIENNYTAPKVDITENTLRFRQIDPSTINKSIWSYTTHRLPDHVDLVIIYKKSKDLLSDNNIMHRIKAKGGELIHIDLNSHNSTGKSKNTMSGGVLDLDPLTINHTIEQSPTYRPTVKRIKSKNPLFNNLSIEDIRDLKTLFSEIGEEEIKKKADISKIRKATVKRVKSEAKPSRKAKKPIVRGTIEGKRTALKRFKRITI